MCLGGEVTDILSCQPKTFDPINGVCSTPAFDCSNLPNGRNPMPQNDMGYIICRDGLYMGKKSCAPDYFDPLAKICRPGISNANCDGKTDGVYAMPGTNTDYYTCLAGVFVGSGTCAPKNFNPSRSECDQLSTDPQITGILPPSDQPGTAVVDKGRCQNKPSGWFPLSGSATDYVVCSNGKEMALDTCKPHLFDFETRRCLLFPCRGVPDGDYGLIGTDEFYMTCINQVLSSVTSCSPGVYDRNARTCRQNLTPLTQEYPCKTQYSGACRMAF